MKSRNTVYIFLSSLNQRQSIFDLRRTRVTGSTTSQGATVVLFGPAAFSIENENCQDKSSPYCSIYVISFFIFVEELSLSFLPSVQGRVTLWSKAGSIEGNTGGSSLVVGKPAKKACRQISRYGTYHSLGYGLTYYSIRSG